jgi:hypothetical protein
LWRELYGSVQLHGVVKLRRWWPGGRHVGLPLLFALVRTSRHRGPLLLPLLLLLLPQLRLRLPLLLQRLWCWLGGSCCNSLLCPAAEDALHALAELPRALAHSLGLLAALLFVVLSGP